MVEKIEKKVICTRIDDRLEVMLKKYTEVYEISNSRLIRKALRYYMRYAQNDFNSTSYIEPIIIISKESFAYLIDNLNEEELQKLAEKTYNTALRAIKKYFEQIGNKNLDPLDLPLKNLLPVLIDNFFSYDAQNWLSDPNFSVQKDIVTFASNHSLNRSFSIFLKLLISNFLKPYNLKLGMERIKENMIYLMFEPLDPNSDHIG